MGTAAVHAGKAATQRVLERVERVDRSLQRKKRRQERADVIALQARDYVQHGQATLRIADAIDWRRWVDRYGVDLPAQRMQADGATSLSRGWHTDDVWLLPGGIVQKRLGTRTQGRVARLRREVEILLALAACPFVPKILHVDIKNATLYTTFCGKASCASADRRDKVRGFLRELDSVYGVYRTDNVGKRFPTVPDSNILRDEISGAFFLVGFGGEEWRLKSAPPEQPTGVLERTWLAMTSNVHSTQKLDPGDPSKLLKQIKNPPPVTDAPADKAPPIISAPPAKTAPPPEVQNMGKSAQAEAIEKSLPTFILKPSQFTPPNLLRTLA